MNTMGLLGGLGLALLGVVLLALAASSAAGTLGRNGALGIRTRATQQSDIAWDAGHRAAASGMRRLGILCVVFAGGLVISGFVWPRDEPVPPGTLVLFIAGYGTAVAGVVRLTRTAGKAATRAQRDHDRGLPPAAAS